MSVLIQAGNRLTGELPTRLGDMRSLAVLDLRKLFMCWLEWENVTVYNLVCISVKNNKRASV